MHTSGLQTASKKCFGGGGFLLYGGYFLPWGIFKI